MKKFWHYLGYIFLFVGVFVTAAGIYFSQGGTGKSLQVQLFGSRDDTDLEGYTGEDFLNRFFARHEPQRIGRSQVRLADFATYDANRIALRETYRDWEPFAQYLIELGAKADESSLRYEDLWSQVGDEVNDISDEIEQILRYTDQICKAQNQKIDCGI